MLAIAGTMPRAPTRPPLKVEHGETSSCYQRPSASSRAPWPIFVRPAEKIAHSPLGRGPTRDFDPADVGSKSKCAVCEEHAFSGLTPNIRPSTARLARPFRARTGREQLPHQPALTRSPRRRARATYLDLRTPRRSPVRCRRSRHAAAMRATAPSPVRVSPRRRHSGCSHSRDGRARKLGSGSTYNSISPIMSAPTTSATIEHIIATSRTTERCRTR
jgi:hypothetical protein